MSNRLSVIKSRIRSTRRTQPEASSSRLYCQSCGYDLVRQAKAAQETGRPLA